MMGRTDTHVGSRRQHYKQINSMYDVSVPKKQKRGKFLFERLKKQ